jgi:hypothetical protein
MTESEQMQARIAVALERAERICAAARSVRVESGPQSEAQWLDEAAAGMSDEEVAAWIETL